MKAVRHTEVHFTTCYQLFDHQAVFFNEFSVRFELLV